MLLYNDIVPATDEFEIDPQVWIPPLLYIIINSPCGWWTTTTTSNNANNNELTSNVCYLKKIICSHGNMIFWLILGSHLTVHVGSKWSRMARGVWTDFGDIL